VRLLLSVLGSLVLLVGGLALFWWLAGPDAHRWVARRTLEMALGREVHVDGTLELELGAEPLLQLTGVRIESPSWAETPNQLQIARAQIQIALRPLLRRVLVFPLIDLEGMTIALETAADGRHSWESDDDQTPPGETRFAIPLFDRLSVKRATITYHDQRDGRRTRLHIDSLTDRRDDTSGNMRIDAYGEINGRVFRIGGTSGNVDAALAATEPWPLDLKIELPSLEGKLTGTVANVVDASGLGLRLEARSPSLLAAAKTWNLSLPADMQSTVGATLKGDLAALSLVDVRAEMISTGGDHLELSGSLGNVWEGSGLDGRLTLKLDPAGQFGKLLPLVLRLPHPIDAAASIRGSVAAPVFDQIAVDAQGPGDSRLKLAGNVRAATTGGVRLHSFDLTSTFDIPDPSAFADRLGFDPARLGGLRGSAELSSANQRIEAKRLEMEASDAGALRFEARGAIGTLAADGAVHLAPDMSFTASMGESRPLLDLIDPNAPELGPVYATGRLVGGNDGYRLDDFELDLGTPDKLTIDAQGKVGPLLPEDLQATALNLAVRFGWPSSQILGPFMGADLPELDNTKGEFELGGTIASLRIHDARLATVTDAGIAVTATGGIASIETITPGAVKGVAFELEARAPSTTLLAQQLGHESPDFGAVRARASLGNAQGPLALSAIRIVAGSEAAPSIEVSGAIGNVLAFEKVELTGDFRIPTRDLLAFADIHGKSDVGRLHGNVHLSDGDGSMGVEHLEAEVRETHLLSLTAQGLIDDLEKLDQVRFQTSLKIPKIASLAEVFNAGGVGLGGFQFDGKLSGDDRRFDADGRAILGKTRFDGVLSGDFRGARPSFKARLHSPQVRLADLGLRPEASGGPSPAQQAAATPHLFRRERLPLEGFRKLDLDLQVQLDRLEGILLAVDRATAHVTLAEGKLRLAPLRFGIVGGRAQADAEVDVRAPTPRWWLRAETDDLKLGETWRQLETQVPLSGELDLVVDLRARGWSPRDLANSLSGNLGFALERGQIRSRLFDLTTVNPLRWLVAQSTRRGYSQIDCFTARFQAVDGVATLRSLALDTPNVIASGEGYIDFARETLDLQIRPSAKHRRMVELATPFTITGSLASPSVKASATGATARALGRVVFSPVNLLGSLLPFVNDRGRDRNNPCLTLSAPRAGTPSHR
jgi:uncharacterized protein involved in outer membrane biogenesis